MFLPGILPHLSDGLSIYISVYTVNTFIQPAFFLPILSVPLPVCQWFVYLACLPLLALFLFTLAMATDDHTIERDRLDKEIVKGD
jgi:hypothetical protein